MLAAEFGVGQVVWSIVWFFLFLMWIMLFFQVASDIFRSADLSGDQHASDHARLEEVWFRLMKFTGQTDEQRAGTIAAWRKSVAFLPLPELEALIASAGFEAPTLFHQALLIRAWFTQRRAG